MEKNLLQQVRSVGKTNFKSKQLMWVILLLWLCSIKRGRGKGNMEQYSSSFPWNPHPDTTCGLDQVCKREALFYYSSQYGKRVAALLKTQYPTCINDLLFTKDPRYYHIITTKTTILFLYPSATFLLSHLKCFLYPLLSFHSCLSQ